jgi:hypothetical protein
VELKMHRWRVSAAAALAAGLVGTTAVAQDEPKPVVIGAPHYGDTLFGFYQDKYFSTIVNLMVSQHFRRVGPHADEAEVLRGGMMLSYGLHEQAAEIFARLIERNAPLSVRNRAWYFLARMRQQRGLIDTAQAALDRIEGALPAPLDEERQLLQAQLMMARQDYAAAATVLEAIKQDPKNPTPGLYARFNLGVALIKTGQNGDSENIARGTALLDQVGQAPGPSEEIKSLRDRANVALGFSALQDKKPREARVALQRVRLNAAQSNKALLGYGWAASELNEPRLALVPWTELASRRADDASVLEAHIAVPYAMAEIGAYGAALEKYQGAVNLFSQEKKALDESIAAIKAGALVRGLLEQNPGEGLGAFARIDQLPEMPHTTHLVPLLADHPFQETFKHLRDLKFLSTNLRGWQDSLATFTDMLDNRRQAFADRLPKVRAAAGAADMGKLEARRAALAEELAKAEAAQDGLVFADAKERALLERVEQARATIARAQGKPEAAELSEAAERLRRVAGALDWQLTQRLPDRQWAARKGLRDGEQALKRAQELDALLLRAQAEEPARNERFAARIAELAARIQALQPQVALLDAEVQAQLQEIATAELQGQQERLDTYAAQARLAIAQILDRAQIAQRQERPPEGAVPR